MSTNRKKQLLDAVTSQIEKLRKQTENITATAKSYKDSSRSEEGDRAIFENTAVAARKNLERALALEKEINSAPTTPTPIVSIPCYVKVKFNDQSEKELYLFNNNIFITGFLLVTPESDFGKEIMRKKVMDTFKYVGVNGKIIEGTILQID